MKGRVGGERSRSEEWGGGGETRKKEGVGRK